MTKPHTHSCPIAAVLNIFGDSWTWLIVREAFYGATRFKDFRRNTGIAKNILSNRLSRLVEEGILVRNPVGGSATRFAYTLSDKGKSLHTVLMAMTQWGNEHIYGKGNEPVVLKDGRTGKVLPAIRARRHNGALVKGADVIMEAGPGASSATRRRLHEAINPLN